MGRTAGLPGTLREVANHLASIQDAPNSPVPLNEVDPGDFDLISGPTITTLSAIEVGAKVSPHRKWAVGPAVIYS
ncbi:hypothetical protein [Streptomyces sp. NPDC046385]|uniref:hypothetical protein n=1 Tax=Streptomyces sp. NPDC046385 TaxID=3154918 RepID=UPI0033F043C1